MDKIMENIKGRVNFTKGVKEKKAENLLIKDQTDLMKAY